jgi:hypothetical protein
VGREALTLDIDALLPSTLGFAEVVKRVGDANGWPATWLNDAVKMYVSHYDTDADWDVMSDGDGVTVLIARAPLLLAMKLYAGRGRRDADDIERLLEACDLRSLSDAVEVFDRYYPSEAIAENALR